MKKAARRGAPLVLVLVLGLLGGCALAPAASPTPATTPTQVPTMTLPAATPTPTASATSSPRPTAPASPAPTVSTGDVVSCPAPSDTPAVPPPASLSAPEATAVGGRLGSYDFCDTSGDAQPPGPASLSAIRLESRMSELTLVLANGAAFAGWSGTYTSIADGSEVPAGGAEFDPASASAKFRGPTAGDWLLRVTMNFGDEVGAADYYWRIDVP